MDQRIKGLHHVTATVSDAQEDLDFYSGLLGLRLVKKTVNFDNHHVFHFYYGDERGTPGTLMTTFPYRGKGVALGRKGAGQITATAFGVPEAALPAWRKRLAASGVPVLEEGRRFGEDFIGFADPSGLAIELIATAQDAREPWIARDLDRTMAIRGVHSVTLTIGIPEPSFALLTDVLGYSALAEAESRTRLGVNGGGPGRSLDILAAPEAPVASNGLGTVHHVAMGVATAEEQLAYRGELLGRGVPVTEVLDRQYFQSIYFREPGGVLYEIATLPPGFLVDEDLASLGAALKLPPWEEQHRRQIEAGLPAVVQR
jgi:glyoxalase family protein